MTDTSFGHWVRSKRKQRRLTQKALGNLIGYAEITVRQVESGSYALTPYMVEKIVSVLADDTDDQASIIRFALQPQTPETKVIGIPRTMTPFIGRERQLEQVQTLLNNPDCALISVVGIGGIGKTRLAIQAVRQFAAQNAVEICFVDLVSISTGGFAQALAKAAGIPLNPFVPLVEQICQSLQHWKVVFLIDNMEHVLSEGVPILNTLLQQASPIKIVVTSRERLRLTGEWSFRLDGFSLIEESEQQQAVQLFVNTAQRINQQFALSDLSIIRDICREVYGIPLAIEMAASWTEVYSCRDILQMIQQQSLDLAVKQRGDETRHKSLRAVFDATWENLSEEEQHVLKRLSLMRGDFTTEAALKISNASRDMLAYLQDKMLIQPQREGRVSLHEMIRQLAYDKLCANPDELRHANTAHAEYFLTLWGQRTDDLKRLGSITVIHLLASHAENLRQAWHTMIAQRRTDWFWTCYEVVWTYHNASNYHADGVQLFTLVMRGFERDDATEDEIRVRIIGRLFSGMFMLRQSRIPEMMERLVSPDIQWARESNDFPLLFWLCIYESFMYYALGDPSAALDAAYHAERYYLRSSNDTLLHASVHFQLGRAQHLARHLDKAVEHLTESLTISRQYGPDWGVSISLTELGLVVEEQEDLVLALDYYNQSLLYTVVIDDWWNYQRARTNVSRIQVTLGNYPEAVTLCLAILENLLENPTYGLEIECFIVVARIFKHTGDVATAVALLGYCATHLECDQITRDRAKSYLEAFNTNSINTTFPSVRLPATKVEITKLLIERLAILQTSGVELQVN